MLVYTVTLCPMISAHKRELQCAHLECDVKFYSPETKNRTVRKAVVVAATSHRKVLTQLLSSERWSRKATFKAREHRCREMVLFLNHVCMQKSQLAATSAEPTLAIAPVT